MSKSREEIITFIKFTLVGVLGAGVGTIIITYMANRIPPNVSPFVYFVPYLLSVEAGILVTFLPNDMWVFRKEKYKLSMWQRLGGYHGALFSGFIVQTIIFGFFLLIRMSSLWAYFMGVGAAALWNYVVSRKAVFVEGGEIHKSCNLWSRFSRKCVRRDIIQKE